MAAHRPTFDTAEDFFEYFVFDLVFLIVLEVEIFNILFGIAFDTFCTLCDDMQSRQSLMDHLCVACSLEGSASAKGETSAQEEHR